MNSILEILVHNVDQEYQISMWSVRNYGRGVHHNLLHRQFDQFTKWQLGYINIPTSNFVWRGANFKNKATKQNNLTEVNKKEEKLWMVTI